MGADKETRLSLVIKAVDEASSQLKSINKEIEKATRPKLGNAFKGVGSALGKVGSEALSLTAKFAGLAAVGGAGLFALVKHSMDVGDKLGEMSQRVGLGVDAYAQLQHAAGQADVDAEQFNGSLDQFSKRLGELKATGGGPLKELGATFAAQLKGAKNTEAALDLVTKAFGKVTDVNQQGALSAVFFGKSGLQMGQFFAQGGEEIKKARAEFAKFNGSQEEFARRSGILDNKLRVLSMQFGGLKNRIATALMPAFFRLSDLIGKFIEKNGDKLVAWAEQANGAFQAWANNGGFDRLITKLGDIAVQGGKLVDMLGGWKGAMVTTAGFMSFDFLTSVAKLTGALWTLNLALSSTKGGLVGLALGPVAANMGNFVTAIRAGYAPMQALNLAFGATAVTAGAVALAVASIGAAVYQLVKHWDELKAANFGDFVAFVESGFGMLDSPQSDEETMHRMNGRPISVGAGAAAPLNTARSTPRGAAGSVNTNNAEVTVTVNGPPGTRVDQAKGNKNTTVNQNVGQSMAESTP